MTTLVTGATGHLGGALARALAEAGATVIAASRELSRAEVVARSLPGDQTHHGVEINQLDENSISSGFAAAIGADNGCERALR